ncbi:hypothetical protein ACFXHA_10305 [Nocardia sp. NPDC059240]|uniref:hypothetical protein n=1 Tax=Nocardia sp. NPDC059240 TaxID=3346786 RepID=UPI003699CD3B
MSVKSIRSLSIFVPSVVGLALYGATGTAAAQPIIDTGPGGEVTVSAPPGQWWKCALYDGLPPRVSGLPPVADRPAGGRSDQPFVTPDAIARFPSGTVVLADCASPDAPIIWLQLLRTE